MYIYKTWYIQYRLICPFFALVRKIYALRITLKCSQTEAVAGIYIRHMYIVYAL